jgi:alpha-amylase/alpha-mannosidase (GH57 family)
MSKNYKYVCIHGHFYQPPRENAWLETVERQESAHPFHDWNSRINFECYAPNAAARILDETGWISRIRNNYNRISFNFGPTLLSWLAENDPEAYSLVLKSDKRSAELFGGHGSAVAQVYSHLIMPLANYRDKVTQVHWGIRDFESRFGRKPEGMWLAETAVDTESLEVLAAHGVKYTILAPRQAKAVRKINTVASPDWQPVFTETVDTRRAYWCNLPSGRKIALFFYDGTIAQEVAFGGLLNSGKALANRVCSTFDDSTEPQLSHVATDGESYGHHHRYGEMALADALNCIEDNSRALLTNYGQFLEKHPPVWEAVIHENSSWSCVHGVERWRADCGCNSGGTTWNQKWRKPLRDTLDWLRDQLIPLFEREGNRLLRDAWAARNDYIEVVLDRSDENIRLFIKKHARRELSQLEKIAVLRMMEIQRFSILMYTSCGWFFDEISGIETNQILQYALRAMDYALDVFGVDLKPEFSKRLATAPSNVFENGAVSFHENVIPTRVTLERVATHFAVASLFESNPESLNLFNYTAKVDFFEKIEAGTPKFAAGKLRIQSRISQAEQTFCYAVLYLGQQHIIGNISASMTRSRFDEMFRRTNASFRAANLGEVIGTLQEYFGPEKFTLSSLFSDEKIKIIREITRNSLDTAKSIFQNVFRDNYQLMMALEEAKMPLPSTWGDIASYVLNAELLDFFNDPAMGDLKTLERISQDIKRWNIRLNDEELLNHTIGRRTESEIERIETSVSSVPRIKWIVEVLEIVDQIGLKPHIWRAQNVFYLITRGYRKGLWVFSNDEWKNAHEQLGALMRVRLK